ncbi:MAG: hypothetical protein ACPHWZ_07660, partial [Longimicrobiales bacterium]
MNRLTPLPPGGTRTSSTVSRDPVDRAFRRHLPIVLGLTALISVPGALSAQEVGGVELMELTIAEAHEAMLARTLTSRQLVEAYLARIDAYDRSGPTINAIIMTNPRALARADSLDRELRRTGA